MGRRREILLAACLYITGTFIQVSTLHYYEPPSLFFSPRLVATFVVDERTSSLQFISYYADSFAMLLVGRTVYGLGIGFCMHAAPLYIAETASADVRGLYISMKEVFIVVGMLYGYIAGFIFYHPSNADCQLRNWYNHISSSSSRILSCHQLWTRLYTAVII